MRRARPLAALVAMLAALALAGCGGIPMSGPVVSGPRVDETEPEFVVAPNGPVVGASPRDIVAGFMNAVRAPQADFQVARLYLTADRNESWRPDDGVIIRAAAPVVTEPVVSGDVAAVSYSFPTRANVDAAGRYHESAETGTRTIDFELRREGGEWRISAVPDGIVLSQGAFTRAFTAVPLYYFDPSGRYLVPDVRWFAARSNAPYRTVAALLGGPDEWLRRSVVNEFPPGTTIGPGSVEIVSGRATVDLSAHAAAASPASIARMREQLAATLAAHGVIDVELTSMGVPLESGGGGQPVLVDPQPDGAVLVGADGEFGYGTADGVVPIPGITEALVADGATAVSLAHDKASAAYRAGDGTVRFVAAGAGAPIVIDDRPDLAAPSLDTLGFVWSAQRGPGGSIAVFDREGGSIGLVVEGIPVGAEIASIAVSRDGTRLLVAVRSGLGSRLLVFGIVRAENVPTGLGPPLELPLPAGLITRAEWVDDRSVVASVEDAEASHIRHIPLGGPSTDFDALPPGAQAVGGKGGAAGIRALVDGEILAAGVNGGWTATGLAAAFLGIQQ